MRIKRLFKFRKKRKLIYYKYFLIIFVTPVFCIATGYIINLVLFE